jgi:flavin reductase (DIM6/NTAB) family NADH-FMN oxidoreductase RutF
MPGADAFEAIVGRIDYPMFVVTTAAGDERAGCLVGFAAQGSIHPPRFLVGISDKNRTYRVLQRASAMAVHLVPDDAAAIVELFGGETGDEADKFARCSWRNGPEGLPLLDDCPSWFAGRILERVRLGDHVGHLLEPFAGDDPADAADRGWFPFSRAKQIDPGHQA